LGANANGNALPKINVHSRMVAATGTIERETLREPNSAAAWRSARTRG
jgi:hypothetical protein